MSMTERDLSVDPLNPATENIFSSWAAVAAQLKLDALAAPTDTTALNASTSAHGLLPKLLGGTTRYLREDGTWSVPAGVGGGSGILEQIQLSSDDVALTLGVKYVSNLPVGMDITKIVLTVNGPSTNGLVTVVPKVNGATVMSTPLTIDQGESSSLTAATQGVFSQPAWGAGDQLTFEVTTKGTGVTGLRAWLVAVRDDTNANVTGVVVGATELINDSFGVGQDLEQVSTQTTTFTAKGGTQGATLTHSAQNSLDDGISLHISGTAAEWGEWDVAQHSSEKFKYYYTHEGNPSETAWFHYCWKADGVLGYKLGVDPTGTFVVQNGASGTTDTANFACALNTMYKVEGTTAVGGNAAIVFYTGANINNNSGVGASDTITVAYTGANFKKWGLGLLNTLAGGGALISPNLANELFNGNGTTPTNATAPTQTNTTASNISGSGGLFSNVYSFNGGWSVRYSGTTTFQMSWYHALHTSHFARIRIKYTAGPTAESMWAISMKNGDNTAVAVQFGFSSADKLSIRNANNGTPAVSTVSLVEGTEYEITYEAVGGGAATMRAYAGATINSANTADAFATVTLATVTATSMSREVVGNNQVLTTAADISYDFLRSSNAAMPSPIGATGSSPLKAYIERVIMDTTTMPANFNVQNTGGNDAVNQSNNEPLNGCWIGASCSPQGAQGTTTAGIALFVGFARRRPDLIHLYKSASNWSGIFSTEEKGWFTPASGTRALPFVNWKVRGTGAGAFTCAQVRDGANDTAIINWARNIETYPYKVFIGLQHEPETNNELATAGNSANEYADMWRHVVTLAKANGASNVIWAWITTGSSSNAGSNATTWNALWPGDDIVDWLCWDPYWSTTNKTDFYGQFLVDGSPSLLAENASAVTGWTAIGGMYGWATTAKTIGVNSLRYSFGGTKPLGLAEYGTWFDVLTDAQAASRIRSIATQISNAPRMKLLLYYNNTQAHINHIDGQPLSEDAYGDMGEIPFFNVGTVNAA